MMPSEENKLCNENAKRKANPDQRMKSAGCALGYLGMEISMRMANEVWINGNASVMTPQRHNELIAA